MSSLLYNFSQHWSVKLEAMKPRAGASCGYHKTSMTPRGCSHGTGFLNIAVRIKLHSLGIMTQTVSAVECIAKAVTRLSWRE